MHILRSTLSVCERCLPRVSSFNARANSIRQPRCLHNGTHHYSTAAPRSRPLRLAVIGSGPAGFYSAYRVMQKVPDARVDMYERLPVPYGLVRFGVAPDHPEVKNCQDKFEEVAAGKRFNFVGNVDVGTDLPLQDLTPYYDALLFAYGAARDKELGITGEDLGGIYSARAFVGWYNGLPEYRDLDPKLDAGDTATVIGQGNVALDVARILLSDLDALRKTDITEYAVEKLSKSRVKRVHVVGRRGPMQAAFTIKEVRELLTLPSVGFAPIDSPDPSRPLVPVDASKLPRQQKRLAQLLAKGSSTSLDQAPRTWSLDFLLSPTRFNPSSASSFDLASISMTRNRYTTESDPYSRDARIESTSDTTEVPSSLAFRSVGYLSTPIPGLSSIGVPFDSLKGIIPNDIYGRVINPDLGPSCLTAGHVTGCYCAGWVKRGPTGVIASTMEDAFTSGDVIARDWDEGVPFLNDGAGGADAAAPSGWDGVRKMLDSKGVRWVGWKDWKRIDDVERQRGKLKGKEREKIADTKEMLKVLDG